MHSQILAYLILFFVITGCGTVYEKKDCEIPASNLGSCLAEAGYTNESIDAYDKFCKKDHNISPDISSLKLARTKRLKELCKDTKTVFKIAFRAGVSRRHSFKCTGEHTQLTNWKEINDDANKIAKLFIEREYLKEEFTTARYRRAEANSKSWGDQLFDRVAKVSPSSFQTKLK